MSTFEGFAAFVRAMLHGAGCRAILGRGCGVVGIQIGAGIVGSPAVVGVAVS